MIRNSYLVHLIMLSGFMVMISLGSCNLNHGKSIEEWKEEERLAIQNFLDNHDTLNFVLKTSGLYYLDIDAGAGLQVETFDTVNIVYTALLLNGTAFDSNVGTDTLKYIINEYYSMVGFNEGLSYMREGGEAIFLIPSDLAFGSSGIVYQGYLGQFLIQAYTPLLFDVKIVELNKYNIKR